MLNEAEKKQAKKLLDEHAELRGDSAALENWIIRARTFFVFVAMRNPELILDVSSEPATTEREE